MTPELPWPPKRPPSDREILASWHVLHCDALKFLRRYVKKSDIRAFLKTLEPRLLEVSIMRETDHAQQAVHACGGENDDARPSFSEVEADDAWDSGIDAVDDDHDDDSEEGEAGGAATIDLDAPYTADTRFCVSMEYSSRTVDTAHPHFAISDFSMRRVSIHPDTAALLIENMKGGVKPNKNKKELKEHRRVIADALVFGFIEKTVEDSAEDEYDDGGVMPTWRNRETDPALDVLTLCPHLRELYMRICGMDDFMR